MPTPDSNESCDEVQRMRLHHFSERDRLSKSQSMRERLFENIHDMFYHRETLRAEWRDVALLGSILSVGLFSIGKNFIPALADLALNPGLDSSQLLQLFHLFLATFPLAIGVALIVTIWVRADEEFLTSLDYPLLLGIPILIFLVFTAISALLGIGGISGGAFHALFSGGDICNQLKPPSCLHFSQNSQLYEVLWSIIVFYYQTYGLAAFLSSIILGLYLGWAITYKLIMHLQLQHSDDGDFLLKSRSDRKRDLYRTHLRSDRE